MDRASGVSIGHGAVKGSRRRGWPSCYQYILLFILVVIKHGKLVYFLYCEFFLLTRVGGNYGEIY